MNFWNVMVLFRNINKFTASPGEHLAVPEDIGGKNKFLVRYL